MKKLLSLILLTLMATIGLSAQTGHLKFAGVTIDGDIARFQANFKAKGFKPNLELNKTMQEGCKAFNGLLVGNDVLVHVYYNDKTRLVFKVKAFIDNLNEDEALQQYEKYTSLLERKYAVDEEPSRIVDDVDRFTVYPKRSPFQKGKSLWVNSLGKIEVLMTRHHRRNDNPYCYSITIEYIDQINYDNQDDRYMEEL